MLRLLVKIDKKNIFFILLLEVYKGKYQRDTNVPKYEFESNNKEKVKSLIYNRIRYKKP